MSESELKKTETEGRENSNSPIGLASLLEAPYSGDGIKHLGKPEREDELTLAACSISTEKGYLKIRTQLDKPRGNEPAEMHILFGCYGCTFLLDEKNYVNQYERMKTAIEQGKYKLLVRENGELDITIL